MICNFIHSHTVLGLPNSVQIYFLFTDEVCQIVYPSSCVVYVYPSVSRSPCLGSHSCLLGSQLALFLWPLISVKGLGALKCFCFRCQEPLSCSSLWFRLSERWQAPRCGWLGQESAVGVEEHSDTGRGAWEVVWWRWCWRGRRESVGWRGSDTWQLQFPPQSAPCDHKHKVNKRFLDFIRFIPMFY